MFRMKIRGRALRRRKVSIHQSCRRQLTGSMIHQKCLAVFSSRKSILRMSAHDSKVLSLEKSSFAEDLTDGTKFEEVYNPKYESDIIGTSRARIQSAILDSSSSASWEENRAGKEGDDASVSISAGDEAIEAPIVQRHQVPLTQRIIYE